MAVKNRERQQILQLDFIMRKAATS